MSFRRLWPVSLAAVTLAAFPLTARANTASPTLPGDATASVPGWQEFVESLRGLPDRMLAKLPEAQRTDPQIQQEVARRALEALASQTISAIGADGDAPEFLPSIGQLLNVGQPNADTIYRSATLTPGGSYRISGTRGSVTLAVIAQVVPGVASNAGSRAQLNLADLKVDAEGRFDVLLSATRPAGYVGEWRELNPAATTLMMRLVSSDWKNEVEPTLSIERVDKAPGRPRPAADLLEQRLRRLPGQVDFLALMFVNQFEKLRQEGFVNKLKILTLDFGALGGQFYYEGGYDLADDEALVIESAIPSKCDYRSLILTNEIYETTDWYNNHSSLNASQAAPDLDGKLRIVVSARDPGIRNWLDTAGYARGIVQGRWTGCDSHPIPTVSKVKFAQLRNILPPDAATVTPAERQEIVRERRRALQERPLW